MATLVDLTNSLFLAVQTLRSRRMNYRLDQNIRPFTTSPMPQELISNRTPKSYSISANDDEIKQKEKEQEERKIREEEEVNSTSLSIVKLCLSNLNMILQRVLD